MLRIDESSKTLVAPQQGGFEPEAPLERSELLPLISAGWQAFAQELGQTHLHMLAVEPEPGVDLLGFDETTGRVVVVLVAGSEPAAGLVGRAMVAAGEVAGWDAQDLAEVHESLTAAVPGDSPRVVLVGGPFGDQLISAIDWLTRRHGMEIDAHQVQMLRFGSERLMQVTRAYPALPGDQAAAGQHFFADVMAPPPPGGRNSAPPPVVSPTPAPKS
jgi:hypothetical protein